MLERRLDLRAVQPHRAVDAAVTDEKTSWLPANRLAFVELHVGQTGTALETEDRLARMLRARMDPLDGQRDQTRVRVAPVLGDDERAAVGGVAALLGAVCARLQRQLAGLGAGRYGDRAAPEPKPR